MDPSALALLERLRAEAFRTYVDVPEALRTYNLRELRDALRECFRAHPVLEEVRFDLRSDYNDSWYDVQEYDGVSVNGLSVCTDELLFHEGDGSVRDEAWFHLETERDDFELYERGEYDAIAPYFRAKYPAETEAAFDVFDTLRSFTQRYGDVFWLDTLGLDADVTVTREALAVSRPQRPDPDPDDAGDGYRVNAASDFRFSSLPAYRDDPERVRLLAFRDAAEAAHAEAVTTHLRPALAHAAQQVFEVFPDVETLRVSLRSHGVHWVEADRLGASWWEVCGGEYPSLDAALRDEAAQRAAWHLALGPEPRIVFEGQRTVAPVLWAWAHALAPMLGDGRSLAALPIGASPPAFVFRRREARA